MKTKGDRTFTGLTLHDKQKRSLAILQLIRKKGVISRTDISRATGINAVSISHYISNFIDENILVEKGLAASSGGRKPELIELNAKAHYCVGIDIGPSGISAVVVDIAANAVSRKRSGEAETRRSVPEKAIGIIREVISSSKVTADKIRAIGVGVSDESLYGVRDAIEKELNIDTFIGGEAVCAAFAEKMLNKDADVDKLLYMHSDLGRGILIDGGDCVGCVGEAARAEAAVPERTAQKEYDADERLKYLRPWNACLGAVKMAKREVLRGVGTKIVSLSGGDTDKISERVIIEAARQKDETALNIMQSVSVTLGLRIAYLINLFAPQVVVIGGGPENAPEITFPLVKKMVDRLSLKELSGSVKILPTATPEDSLCMGAAALAVREVFLKA